MIFWWAVGYYNITKTKTDIQFFPDASPYMILFHHVPPPGQKRNGAPLIPQLPLMCNDKSGRCKEVQISCG